MRISNIERMLSIGLLVPLGDPNSPSCRWGLPQMLWGDPGIGKSERVETAGAQVGLPVRTTYVPTCQPEDAAGSAFMNSSKGMAMLEAALNVIEEQVNSSEQDKEAMKELAPTKHWFLSALSLSSLSSSGFTKKVLKEVTKAARLYGKNFSRIEPLLPGIGDLMVDGSGVWFVDELTSGRPAVQAAFLGAVLNRKVGGLNLPGGVRVIAAGNPEESAAGGWGLEPPMANRFWHGDVTCPNTSQWGEWLMSGTSNDIEMIDNGEDTIRATFDDNWAVTRGEILGFMHTKAVPLLGLPKEGDPQRGRAWGSPRTFYFAARARATCKCLGIDEETSMNFVEGCVGEGAAVAMAAWLKDSDLPHPKDTLSKGWKIDKKRLDRNYAVYSGMIAYVTSRTNKNEKLALAVPAWTILEEASASNMLDMVLPAARSLVRAGLSSSASPEIHSAAQPVLSRLAKSKVGRYASKI